MAIGDVLANPLTGFIRVDERNSNITYNPVGVQGSNANFNASTYTTVDSGYIRFNFTGTSLKLIGGAIPTNFTFSVYIDSETKGMTYSCPANSGAKVLFFEIEGLSDTEHSIIIKDFTSFRMDAVDILTGKSLMPYRVTIHNKILLSSGYKYSLKDSTVFKMETDSEKNFLNYGADLIPNFNGYVTKERDLKSTSVTLGIGKTFEHTVDLSKRRVDKITLG
ncbi:hypothetical protein [Paenibacillus xylanexedens]|uniref:hypothetical protein n=1 Tax=Paenibacillus xylanexedens TaxID=528191 RepID=UPI0011A53376|nr:hypothetical protein [Paenibacillus xylanexedens]